MIRPEVDPLNFTSLLEAERLTVDPLRDVASKYPISLRHLGVGELPTLTQELGGPILETAYVERPHDSALLFYGNTHGLIFPFLQEARRRAQVSLPIKQILNVDYHADIAPYTELFDCHTATWQRYGVVNGLWSSLDSYNWQPDDTKAPPLKGFTPEAFIHSVDTEQAAQLDPDVLSIDIDFFLEQEPDNPEFNRYMDVLTDLVKRTKCVLVFSSSGFTTNRLSLEMARQIVANVQESFLGPAPC